MSQPRASSCRGTEENTDGWLQSLGCFSRERRARLGKLGGGCPTTGGSRVGNERIAHAASPRDPRGACGLGPVPGGGEGWRSVGRDGTGGQMEIIVCNSLLILHPFSWAAILHSVVKSFLENSFSGLTVILLWCPPPLPAISSETACLAQHALEIQGQLPL